MSTLKECIVLLNNTITMLKMNLNVGLFFSSMGFVCLFIARSLCLRMDLQ